MLHFLTPTSNRTLKFDDTIVQKGAPKGNRNAAGPHSSHGLTGSEADGFFKNQGSNQAGQLFKYGSTADHKQAISWHKGEAERFSKASNNPGAPQGKYQREIHYHTARAAIHQDHLDSQVTKSDTAQKFNPYHGEGGLFSDGESATFVSTGPKFKAFLNRAKGMHTGPNKGAGYSGKVAAGINKVMGNKPNPDHRLVSGMKSHTVDVNAKSREDFNNKRSDAHQLLQMNGFKHTGTEYLHRGQTASHTYEHANGAAARLEHEVDKPTSFNVDVFHGQSMKTLGKKSDMSLASMLLGSMQSIAEKSEPSNIYLVATPEGYTVAERAEGLVFKSDDTLLTVGVSGLPMEQVAKVAGSILAQGWELDTGKSTA